MSAFTFPLVPNLVFLPHLNSYIFPVQAQPLKSNTKSNQEIIVLSDDEESKEHNQELNAYGRPRKVRWKKQDDMRLFQYLEQHCRQNQETVTDLLHKADNIDETDDFWATTAK